MTLGVVLPAALAIIALGDILAFRILRANGGLSQRNYTIWGAAAIALPIIAYVVLNFLVPSWGEVEVF